MPLHESAVQPVALMRSSGTMPKQHPAVSAMAIANPAVIARRTLVLTNGGCLECADQCRLPLRTGVTAVASPVD